jgi:hypothetical protein
VVSTQGVPEAIPVPAMHARRMQLQGHVANGERFFPFFSKKGWTLLKEYCIRSSAASLRHGKAGMIT